MAVQARMRVAQIEEFGTGGRKVILSAVYSADKSDPNYSYSAATPSATLTMYVNNPDAYDQFEQGKSYDLLFTPTPES